MHNVSVVRNKKPQKLPEITVSGKGQSYYTTSSIPNYFGARYLDPRTSRWLSVDPAMYQGDYIPGAPINDEVRRNNNNLPGMGGIYNYVNMHVYHYGGNNPIKYVDPDGRDFYNFTEYNIVVRKEEGGYVLVRPREVFRGRIDGAIIIESISDNGIITGTIIKVTGTEWGPNIHVSAENIDGEISAFVIGENSNLFNNLGDTLKLVLSFIGRSDLLSGVYDNEGVSRNPDLQGWIRGASRYINEHNLTSEYSSPGVFRIPPRQSRSIRYGHVNKSQLRIIN